MVETYMAQYERILTAMHGASAVSGHSVNIGTAREAFVHDFLTAVLGRMVGIGTGEIIDASSTPGAPRNQIDVVVFNPFFPAFKVGGNINAFLIESTIATIEVKSTLDKEALRQVATAAMNIKSLSRATSNNGRNVARNTWPQSVVCYAVAYAGPEKMATVYGWIRDIYAEMNIAELRLPANEQRFHVPSPAIDGIFVLGHGFILHANSPLGLIPLDWLQKNPDTHWVYSDQTSGNLLPLFVLLNVAISTSTGSGVDLTGYTENAQIQNISIVD